MTSATDHDRMTTGVPGLDTVLHGGLIPERGYLLRGTPGAGKTILALHFLTATSDDTSLFVNLEEDEGDIRRNAETLGFNVDDIQFLDLTPSSDVFIENRSYSVFEPNEVETEPIASEITEQVRSIDPDRVVIDPVTQFRYLAPDEYQFRKQVTGIMQFFEEEGVTVLFTSQATQAVPDDDLQFISHGIIDLEHSELGRSIRVPKFRGSPVADGWHGFRITESGIRVFPKLQPTEHGRDITPETISSGVPEIDELLHGGIERGTVTILSGPTGVGKTTLGAQFMKEAAGRGERSVIYQLEENAKSFLNRCAAVNIPVKEMQERGTLQFVEVEPLSVSASEFAHNVRTEVEENGAKIVMIDGTGGYQLSLVGNKSDLVTELHSLCRYLKNMGVTAILVEEIQSITGDFHATTNNISYIADNIVFLRYLEFQGELRKTIGVLKKRMTDFERTLRQFQITEHGIKVGEPLADLRGILRGTPDIATRSGDRPMRLSDDDEQNP